MPRPATEVIVARYGPVIRACSSRLGGHEDGEVEGVEDRGQRPGRARPAPWPRRAGPDPRAASRPGARRPAAARTRPPSAAPAAPASAMPRTANGTAAAGTPRSAGEDGEVLLDRVQAADRGPRRAPPAAAPGGAAPRPPRPAAAARPRRPGAAGPPGTGSRAPRPPGRRPRSPSRPARSRRGRTARSPRTPSAPARAARPPSSSRRPGRTSPPRPRRRARRGPAPRWHPRRGRRPRPRSRSRRRTARRRAPTVQTTKATACRTDARTTAPRRDHAVGERAGGHLGEQRGDRPDREQHRDLRVGQAGVEEEQRVERVVRHQLGQRGPAHGQPGERPCGGRQRIGRRASTERHARTMNRGRCPGNRIIDG